MENVCSYKDFNTLVLGIKDVDGKKGIVTGYASDFDSLDSDGDVIEKGAFTKTLSLNGPKSKNPRIKHLLNHSPSQPLGVPMELREDSKGLYYESKIGNHSLGMDFIKMVESDLIKEHSIGYQVKKFNQVTPWDEYKEGDVRRKLTELKLWEFSSLTAWGANPNTPLTGLKGVFNNEIEINKLVNQAEAIEDFCRNSTATDETIQQLLTYNKQLLKVITDSRSGVPASTQVHSEHNEEKKDDAANDAPAISMPSTVECPSCLRRTHNTQEGKGFIKCHRCVAVFVYGSKQFIHF
jgi:HK97 family phage prohead protease